MKVLKMQDKINYNLAALMGSPDVTDEEYVEQFGLDPASAHTPLINTLMLDQVQQKNIDHFIRTGMSEPDAIRKAGNIRLDAEKQVKTRLAAKGLL